MMIAYVVASIYVSSHKKELLERANTEISNQINGRASIGDISVSFFKTFPYLTLSVYAINVEDSLYKKHHHKLLYADQVYARINPFRLIIGSLRLSNLEIRNGGFYLYTDSTGYSNAYMLKGKGNAPPKQESESTKKLLDDLKLVNFSATINDERSDKLYDFTFNELVAKTTKTDSSLIVDIEKSLLVKDLAFNLENGSFLHNRLLEGNYSVEFIKKKQELRFKDIEFSISGQPFQFTGDFLLGKEQHFELTAISKNILVDSAKKILTPNIAKAISIVSVKTPLDVVTTLGGSLSGGDPLVVVKWTTKNNEVVTPIMNLTDCSFSGLFTNEVVKGLPLKDPNSKIEVNDLTGKWMGLPVTVKKFILNNLSEPDVKAQLLSTFQLQDLNNVIQSDALSLIGGTGNMEINYEGPIDHVSPKNASVTGFINLEKGVIEMSASKAQLTNCEAKLNLQNTDLSIEKLTCQLAGNPFNLTATAKNVLSLVGDSQDPVSLNMNCSAPLLNINRISSIISRKYPVKPKKGPKSSGSLSKTVSKIDNLLSSGMINVNVNADKLVYKKFEAKKVNANIAIGGDGWELKNASLSHGDGSLAIHGIITQQKNQQFLFTSKIKMKNLDAKNIWYSFDNFGIKSLTYKNIEGTLTSDVTVSLLLNKDGNFDLNSLSGDAALSIKNGKLLNFGPIENIDNFLLGDRDFHEIRFAEIKNNLSFKKGEVSVQRMEINSSVLSLFVEGIYSMNGKTDISIQVPLSNLKNRNKEYKPENTGAGRGGGMSVFLRATTADDGSIKIKYDPLKRFRKSNVAKENKKTTKNN